MAFHILIKLKNETVRADLPLYFGAIPLPGEVLTLEIDGRVVQVRVAEISGGNAKKAPASRACTVRAFEI